MKDMSPQDAEAIYDLILAIDLDEIEPVSNKRLYLKELAVPLRKWLKSYGLTNRKISVVVPNYSMAMSVDVNVPTAGFYECFGVTTQAEFVALDKSVANDRYENVYKRLSQKRSDAQWHLKEAIDRAFPQNVDRSNPVIDYFDYTFNVW